MKSFLEFPFTLMSNNSESRHTCAEYLVRNKGKIILLPYLGYTNLFSLSNITLPYFFRGFSGQFPTTVQKDFCIAQYLPAVAELLDK